VGEISPTPVIPGTRPPSQLITYIQQLVAVTDQVATALGLSVRQRLVCLPAIGEEDSSKAFSQNLFRNITIAAGRNDVDR